MSTDKNVLKRFMKEHFPYGEFKRIGFFTKEMRADYEAQADRVRTFFGYTTVYEYGSQELRCLLNYGDRPLHIDSSGDLQAELMVTVIPSIYE